MYVNVCMYTTYNMYMGTHIYIIYIWTHIYLSHVSGLYIFIYDVHVCMHKYIYMYKLNMYYIVKVCTTQ